MRYPHDIQDAKREDKGGTPLRIGIDARFLTHPQAGGFKTYTKGLVEALARIDQNNRYLLYVDRPMEHDFLKQQDNFTVRTVSSKLSAFSMPLREQILLPWRIAKDDLDLVHFPCLTSPLWSPCPYVLTVHDTIWLHNHPYGRSPKRWGMWLYNRWVPVWAIRHARLIIAVSRATKHDIVKYLRVPSAKIIKIPEAAGDIFVPQLDRARLEGVRRRYKLDSDFILGIGSASPRKNIQALIHAFALDPFLRSKYQLVIVWTHSLLEQELQREISTLEIAHQVRFLRRVSNEDLALLYNAASLFVFPSLYEGFGLPPLEAMACGTPVVAANNSSIPEVVGDAAILVDASDVKAIAEAMTQVLTDMNLRHELRERGLQRAQMFSWERCARETLTVYERAAAGHLLGGIHG